MHYAMRDTIIRGTRERSTLFHLSPSLSPLKEVIMCRDHLLILGKLKRNTRFIGERGFRDTMN